MRLSKKLKIQKNQANNILAELLNDCTKYYSVKRRVKGQLFRVKFIHFYDIRTLLIYYKGLSSNNKQTIEILIRFEYAIEQMQLKIKKAAMPLKALKILIKSTQKANCIEL